MTTNIYNMADTWNAIGTTFDAVKMNVTDGAGGFPVGAAASQLINMQTNATQRFGVRSPHFALGADVTPFLNLSDIWNTSGIAVGIRYNVVDTVSSVGSFLLDLQVGGVSKLNVIKSGTLTIPNGNLAMGAGSTLQFGNANASIGSPSNGFMAINQQASPFGQYIFGMDAANIMALRNGVSPQTIRIYNTFTSATSFERFYIDWSQYTNMVVLGPEAGSGGGTARTVILQNTPITLASLPTATSVGSGARAFITDATLPVIFTTAVGGGATPRPVLSNGIQWLIG